MTNEPVKNPEIFVWALYELDGANEFVDVEDVFLKVYELAPLRFSWRTRLDLPDLKKCSKALQEAEAWRPPLFVKKGAETRKLTVEGQQWVEGNFERLAELLGSDSVVQAPKSRVPSRLISQALQTSVFKEWVETSNITDERWRIAEMLRCAPDSSRKVFADRLETLRGAAYAAGRLDALEFLNEIAAQRPEWF